MKKTFLVIVSLFLYWTSTQAQVGAYYIVQVGTFIDAKAEDFKPLREYGLVHAQNVGGNLLEVYFGGFSDKAEAQKAATKVKEAGYANAFVQERLLSDGNPVAVIQMATRQTNKPIEWEKFMTAGDIYGLLEKDLVKVVTGVYPNTEAAKADLARVQKLGFKDAFVKSVNSVQLHRLTEFETGVKKPLIPIEFDQTAKQSPSDIPSNYEVLTPRDPNQTTSKKTGESIPSSYDYYEKAGAPKSESYQAEALSVSMPAINGKVKRTSALDLQKLLKTEGTYTSSLDGYYGAGTGKAYDKTFSENRTIQKYQVLSENMNMDGTVQLNSALQTAIDHLPGDLQAQRYIESSNEPLAQAYHAYLVFIQKGAGREVNTLMNAAIRGAFDGKTIKNLSFDPNATYAYERLDQLILHIHYIHCASPSNNAVPCWMYQKHTQESALAYQACADAAGEGLLLQTCGQFESWPEVKTLLAVAADLNTDKNLDKQRIAEAASERARLYLAPAALGPKENKAVEQWNTNLISGLDGWADRDPLNKRLVTAFKLLYYQSQVRLEDYYMTKGLKAEEARGLALATLHTLVAYHLERFV